MGWSRSSPYGIIAHSMRWNVLTDQEPQSNEEVVSILLANRSITDTEAFFSPKHPANIDLESVEIDPGQVAKTIELLEAAIRDQEQILVFGDYDADGISATAIVWRVLHELGAEVRPFIPHREKHGYGISDKAIDDILADDTKPKPGLIITVDNGIVAHKPIERLKAAGITTIVTDHHQPEADLPPADAVVHSSQLCGATVGWMLMREVVIKLGTSADNLRQVLLDQLDLCGIATIADQVPLTLANRSFAKYGVEALRDSKRVGLKALVNQARLNQAQITTSSINFVIGPRINAMGRLESGLDALRLLCTQDEASAEKLASLLGSVNYQRQDMTFDMVQSIEEGSEAWEDQHLIIVSSAEYHEGVIGLLAGRLAEKYHKPAVVLAEKEGFAKASARSVPGVNIIDLIREVRDDLLEVGGHPMAAGFSVSLEKIELVQARLQQLAIERIGLDLLEPTIDVECFLPYHLTHEELLEEINRLEPFGKANPRPIFGWHGLTVLDAKPVGKEHQHLKLVLTRHTTDRPLTCMWWRHGDWAKKLLPGTKLDLAGELEFNYWNDQRSLQVRVVGLRMVE